MTFMRYFINWINCCSNDVITESINWFAHRLTFDCRAWWCGVRKAEAPSGHRLLQVANVWHRVRMGWGRLPTGCRISEKDSSGCIPKVWYWSWQNWQPLVWSDGGPGSNLDAACGSRGTQQTIPRYPEVVFTRSSSLSGHSYEIKNLKWKIVQVFIAQMFVEFSLRVVDLHRTSFFSYLNIPEQYLLLITSEIEIDNFGFQNLQRRAPKISRGPSNQ